MVIPDTGTCNEYNDVQVSPFRAGVAIRRWNSAFLWIVEFVVALEVECILGAKILTVSKFNRGAVMFPPGYVKGGELAVVVLSDVCSLVALGNYFSVAELNRDVIGGSRPGQVVLIGATNRPDALDPALRRAGRFDKEIGLGIPDQMGRERIVRVLCRAVRVADQFEWTTIAKLTPGYVGADLASLATEACMCAVNRCA